MSRDQSLTADLSRGRDCLYLGAAGEHWVAANLLRAGFNANVLPVDTGVDLLASKKSPYSDDLVLYKVQVKTTAGVRASIRFPKSKIDDFVSSCVNLVVVQWPEQGVPRCVVFTPRLLHMMTSGGFQDPAAPLRASGEFINMTVKFAPDGGVFVRNRRNPFTAVANRLDLIESVECDPTALPGYAVWSANKGQLIEFDDDLAAEGA
jgi:hypothetical protein